MYAFSIYRGLSAAQIQRQTQAVEFAQRNRFHHASGMQPCTALRIADFVFRIAINLLQFPYQRR